MQVRVPVVKIFLQLLFCLWELRKTAAGGLKSFQRGAAQEGPLPGTPAVNSPATEKSGKDFSSRDELQILLQIPLEPKPNRNLTTKLLEDLCLNLRGHGRILLKL